MLPWSTKIYTLLQCIDGLLLASILYLKSPKIQNMCTMWGRRVVPNLVANECPVVELLAISHPTEPEKIIMVQQSNGGGA
jgi:hypothetical protein